jgi:Uma2 family endonuclease
MAIHPPPDLADVKAIRAAVRALRPGESFRLDRPITVDEFYDLTEDESHAELSDGVIVVPSPPTLAHEELFDWFHKVTSLYVEERRLGRVYGSRTSVRLSEITARQPDIAFVSTAHLDRLQRLEIAGAADFVVEIVDSARARRDAQRKQSQYEAAGVEELWIIDLPRRELHQFLLVDGRYRELPVDRAGQVGARRIAGFRLTVAWLFQGPDFPRSLEVVTNLLAAPTENPPQ